MQSNLDISQTKPKKLWNKYFIMIFICGFLTTTAGKYYESTLSLHIVDNLSGKASFAGVLMTCFTIAATFSRILGGWLCDRVNRFFACAFGIVMLFLGCLGFSIFPENFALMIPFRALQGVGFATAGAAFTVASTDTIPLSRMGEGVGYFGLNSSLASAVGPLIAIALLNTFGFDGISVAALLTLGIALTLTILFCRYERDKNFVVEKPEGEELLETEEKVIYRGIWKFIEKRSLKPALLMLFFAISVSSVLLFLTLYAERVGIKNTALFFTFSAIAMVAVRFTFGKLDDKHGFIVPVVTGAALIALSFIMLVIFKGNEILYYITGVVYGCGCGFIQPALTAEAVRGIPATRRGAAIATINIPVEIGIAVGSLVWGAVVDAMDIVTEKSAASFVPVFIGSAVVFGVLIMLAFIINAASKKSQSKA